ncbi:hypothetical protein [Aquaspirillum serpens]|uniref:hypothetical protein n=1 Tax=Aquaspirillum serpens TaxID=190 RepID=UPI00058CC10E|nr:hypothetical protein [Aquaspirillum serpens]
MQKHMLFVLATAAMLPIHANARDTSHGSHGPVSDQVIIEQEANLAKNTENKCFGLQAPRDIDAVEGNNPIIFNTAPPYTQVNQLPSKDRSFMVRKTRHIPDIYKAGCTNGSLCNPPLFGFAAMPREGCGRRTDDSAIPPLTQVRGFLAEVL